MRRAILLALTIIAAFVAAPSPAQAAGCSITQASFDPETQALAAANEVSGNWDVKCGANYRVKLVLQYSDATGWHNATCQLFGFGPPCPVTRPSSGWYQGVTEHSGNEPWSLITPGNVCNNHQFRIEEVFTFQNGSNGLTFIPHGWDPAC